MVRHTRTLSRSFAGGEMSPEMFSRIDDVKFQAGAETLLNCIPRPTGAVTRRPGTRLIRETRDSTKVSHLFSFIASQAQSSVIEAGRATIGSLDSGYFRFHTDGGTLLFPLASLGFKPPLNTDGRLTFSPRQTVSCSIASPMIVTLTGHGLKAGDQVQFVSNIRTLPDAGNTGNADRPLPLVQYYLRDVDDNSFQLSSSPTSASRVNVTQHAGFAPVVSNSTRWRGSRFPQRGLLVSEHRVQDLEPIAFTMYPDASSPTVTFARFPSPDGRSSFNAEGLVPKFLIMSQQVLFVASIFGGTLPINVVEGRLYWITGWTAGQAGPKGWSISETKNGPNIDIGSLGSGTIRASAAPDIELLGGGADGNGFEMMKRYFAVVFPTDLNVLHVETTIGNAQKTSAGLVFSAFSQGFGPFKVHRAYEKGDIATSPDSAGGIRSYYCQKSWWDPESDADQDIITAEMHAGSGSRSPGSTFRTSAEQSAYWRELPGRASGAPMPFTAADFVASVVDQVFNSISIGHGFVTGQAVAIVEGTQPQGFDLDKIYYAIVDSTSSIRLATTFADAIAGTAIDGPTLASPRHGSLMLQAFAEFDSVSFANKVRWPSHGLSNGDTIVFGLADLATTTMQGGLTAGTVYYVREADTDTFRVSATAAGALIVFSGSDGDLVTAIGDSIYEVPHNYSEAELPRIGTTQSGDVMTLASQDHPVLELRRLSTTKWETLEPEFIAAAPVPGPSFEVLIEQGEGQVVTGTVVVNATEHYLISAKHTFNIGTPVFVDDMPTTGLGSLADGYYVVGDPSGQPGHEERIYLQTVESNKNVLTGGQTVLPTILDGRVRYGTQGEDRSQTYVVTAIDQNNEESAANESIDVAINLFVSGASATIGWGASNGAVRYRIYKEISGLFGMIGETDQLQFKDDNIGPDLAVTPPILDDSLRRTNSVTFDATADTVAWVDHGLLAKTPVIFETSDELPGVDEGKTYYVLNPGEDEFQLTDDLDVDDPTDITGTDTGRHNAIAGNFPATATYFEGRRVFGGSRPQPQDIWMTASGTEADLSYSIPTVDTDRIFFRIASRELSAIRHLIPLSQLVLLSDSTEYRLTPVNDDALTPSSISVRPQTFIGCGFPQPSLVNNTVVFAAARGGHMRELGYNRDVLSYLTGDLSLRAGHLFDGFTIVDQAYAKAPLPVVWCVSSSGKLLGITYIPEEGVSAWHQHTTGSTDIFESVTVVPEGDVDATYVIVKRTINGMQKRFVERLADLQAAVVLNDAYHVDCGLTYEGAATTTIAGLDHLEGEAVSFLADGKAGTGTVTSGVLTLTTAASTVHVGLNFITDVKTLPLSMLQVDAFGTGRQKNVNQVWVRIFDSGAFESGPDASNLRPSRSPAAGTIENGQTQVTFVGDWNDDAQILVRQSAPLPLTVSGITIEVASGG